MNMNDIAIVGLCIMGGTLISVIWTHRFDIYCWWEGQKAARRAFPDRRAAAHRHWYAKRWALNLHVLREIARAHRGIK